MNTKEFLKKAMLIDAINETASKQSTEVLRDYFAAAALTGMYAGYQGNAPEPEQVASDAYYIADEMLKEREK